MSRTIEADYIIPTPTNTTVTVAGLTQSGASTFDGASTFNGTSTFNGAITSTGTSTFTGSVVLGTDTLTQPILVKTADVITGIAGTDARIPTWGATHSMLEPDNVDEQVVLKNPFGNIIGVAVENTSHFHVTNGDNTTYATGTGAATVTGGVTVDRDVAILGSNCRLAGTTGTLTFSGPWAAPIDVAYTVTCWGKFNVLVLDTIPLGVCTVATHITSTALPAEFHPHTEIQTIKMVTDGGVQQAGLLTFFVDGHIEVYATPALTSFTIAAVVDAGLNENVLMYSSTY